MKTRILPAILASALCSLSSGVYAQKCTAPSFEHLDQQFYAGTGRIFAKADFNLDGKPDFAIAGSFVGVYVAVPASFNQSASLGGANSVAAGDVNHDGKPDLVTVHALSDNISVRLGDGTGAFLSPTTINPATSPPADVGLGDFDNDGNLDLVVGYNGSGIAVHLGDGLGDFGDGTLFPMSFTDRIAVADIDHDGNLDVVATESLADRIHVALGRGNGSFDPPTPYATGNLPRGLVIEDFDKDGNPDIMTAGPDLSFLRGTGTGAFVLANTVPTANISVIDTGDFDNDGRLDVVVPDGSGQLLAYLGDGTGDFQSPVSFGLTQALGVAVADFNLDGRDDIAATTSIAPLGLNLFQNDFGFPCEKPSFEMLGRRFQFDTYPFALASGDFDLDGNLDVVTTDPTTDSVTMRLGLGNGDLQAQATFGTGDSPISIAAADFNRDSHVDVVTANANSTDLHVLTNDGFGVLSSGSTVPLAGPPVEVAAADVSGDGNVNLMVTLSSGLVEVAFGNGDGTFASSTTYAAGPRPDGLAVGDFNKDGWPDLAVANWITNQVFLLQNAGDGTFPASFAHSVGSGTPTGVRVGDFNGDTNLDVVVSYGLSATASVRTMLGDGAFGLTPATPVIVGGAPDRSFGLTVGDFDRNGTLDVAVGITGRFGINVLRGNGSGALALAGFVPTGFVPRAVLLDDFDRDGVLDLITTLPDDNDVGLLPGDGTGRFAPEFFPSASADSRGVASGDFDHDGMVDLVVPNYDNDSFSFLRGLGGGSFAPEVEFSLTGGANPVWVTAADFNHDGHLDVVTSDSGTGNLTFVAGDGAGSFSGAIVSDIADPPKMTKSADLDRDGDLDLVVLPALGNYVLIVTNNGSGSFTVQGPSTIPLNSVGGGIVVADFDRKGGVDIAVTHASPDALTVFWESGLLTWDPGPQIPIAPGLGDFDAADFNADGTLDFVVPAASGQVELVLSTGPAVWGFNAPVAVGLEPVSARAADFNADGHQDFVVASRFGHELIFWMGDGAGASLAQSTNTIGLNAPRYLAVADFNMDARPDIAVVPDTVVRSDPQGGVSIVLNTSCLVRRLWLITDVSTCDAPGTPFSSQPYLEVVDDGLNRLFCEMDPVSVSFVPGTNPGGANVGGTNPLAASSGSVPFTDLSVDSPGAGYQLDFAYPGLSRRTESRAFSQGLMPTIFGPAAVCQNDTAIYDAGYDYDQFEWKLDSSSVSRTRQVDLTLLLTPGTRTLDLDIVQDSCPAFESMLIDVTPNLSSVTINPAGPENVCEICAGTNMTSLVTGGGIAAYQWGYRTVSLGPTTSIPGETGWDYTLDGSDFPGTGTYFLVLTVTPTCGAAMVSNEVIINVSPATAPNPPITITTLATNNQNYLEWATPTAGPCTNVRIIRNDAGAFPTDPNDLTTPNVHIGDFACPGGGKDAFADTSVLNDTKYYYAAWVWDGATFSANSAEVTGRPFNNLTGNVMWAYATGATSVAAPGLRVVGGVGTVYVVSNDNLVHAVDGATGVWPPNWKPTVLGGPAQSRPPVTRFSVGIGGAEAVNGALFVGSQDGDVYAIDGDEGDLVWQSTVAGMVQAAPAGIFTGFGGAQNLILVGSRDGGTANVFRAFDVETGAPAWAFTNSAGQGGDGTDIGIISGGAAVDYTNQRVFFASHKAGNASVWSVDFTGAATLEWSVDIGDVETSPIYLRSPGRIVIGNNASRVHMLDPDNAGASIWSAPYNASDGAVKGFVFPHFGTPFYIFSTMSKVQSIRDSGPGLAPVLNWQLPVSSPSTPLQIPGTNRVLFGAAAGVLFQLDAIETTTPFSTNVILGDGLSTVGAPTIDLANNIIYVGTTEGVIYAVMYPLP